MYGMVLGQGGGHFVLSKVGCSCYTDWMGAAVSDTIAMMKYILLGLESFLGDPQKAVDRSIRCLTV